MSERALESEDDGGGGERHPAGFGAVTHCPRCGGELTLVLDGPADFECDACGRCWHVEMGYVHRVFRGQRSDVPGSERPARR